MTETLHGPPPAPPPPPERRLARDPDEKLVAGVCAGFGRYTDTDPVLWRVAVGVLTVFGGAGVVLYLLGWVLLPRVGEAEAPLERLLRRPDRSMSALGVVLLVVVGVVAVLGLGLSDGPGFGVVLVLGVLVYLVLRERRQPPAPVYGPAPYEATASSYGPATWSDGGAPAASRKVRERRPRSALGPLVLSATAVVTGVLLALRLAGADGLTAPRIVAGALLVVGAGLLVGAWWGRARWLIALGVALCLLLGATAAAHSAGVDGSVGERRWVVTGDDSYSLGAGEGVLDLRGLQPGERAEVSARVGLGQITVLVPEDLVVDVATEIGLGELVRIDADGGRTVYTEGDAEADVSERFTVGGPADGRVELDLRVRVGEVVVRSVER